MRTPEQSGEAGAAESKLGWLITGRLVTAVLLGIAGTLWTTAGESQQPINKSLGLLIVVAGLTIVYALIFRLSKNVLAQARFQLAIDILLVTWLVWHSAQSPYIALYIVIIAVSSLFLGPRGALVTSVGCAVAFTACAFALTGVIAPTQSSALVGGSISQTVQSVGLFD